ncbi:hypothetical protein PTKU46_79900 [Paraburkholderia terrae]
MGCLQMLTGVHMGILRRLPDNIRDGRNALRHLLSCHDPRLFCCARPCSRACTKKARQGANQE